MADIMSPERTFATYFTLPRHSASLFMRSLFIIFFCHDVKEDSSEKLSIKGLTPGDLTEEGYLMYFVLSFA